MKKELNDYIEYINNLKEKGKVTKEDKEKLLIKIGFFEHERMIHLIVTFFTGVSAILFLIGFLIVESIPLLLLFTITLLLFIPYIIHYYHLENGTQYLQKIYFEI